MEISREIGGFSGRIGGEKQRPPAKNRAPMIRYQSQKQLSLEEFDWPFQTALD
jgi:hypothetical protein